ncbi:MAG: MlaD family protein [Mycobacteriaceae bacterium]
MTVENIPLPSKGIAGDTVTIHALFSDALNLPSKAQVKLNGGQVGEVSAITTTNYIADVELKISQDISLPQDIRAELRQATPLGDVYVSLLLPTQSTTKALLTDGDTIALEHTSTGASVEEVLSSIATVVSGSSLAQIQTIVSELNAITSQNPSNIHDLIVKVTSITSSLNANTKNINRILEEFTHSSVELAKRNNEINQILKATGPAILTLANTTNELVTALTSAGTASEQISELIAQTSPELTHLISQNSQLSHYLTDLDSRLLPAFTELSSFGNRMLTSAKSDYLALYVRVSSLDLPATFDPGSRWWNFTDLGLLGTSLVDTLNRVWARITGNGVSPTPSVENNQSTNSGAVK